MKQITKEDRVYKAICERTFGVGLAKATPIEESKKVDSNIGQVGVWEEVEAPIIVKPKVIEPPAEKKQLIKIDLPDLAIEIPKQEVK